MDGAAMDMTPVSEDAVQQLQLDMAWAPQFLAWREGWSQPPTWTFYLGQEGSLDLALAMTTLFWPRVIVHQGCYLRARPGIPDPPPAPTTPLLALADQQAFERLHNHLHMYDLFATDEPTPAPLAGYEYLAKILLQSWRAALAAQHPGVTFAFSYATEPDDYGPTISFWHGEE